MVKLPAAGFMQDTYCTLLISFRDSLLLSYLGAQQKASDGDHSQGCCPLSVSVGCQDPCGFRGSHSAPLQGAARLHMAQHTGPCSWGESCGWHFHQLATSAEQSSRVRPSTSTEIVGSHRSDSGLGQPGWGQAACREGWGAAGRAPRSLLGLGQPEGTGAVPLSLLSTLGRAAPAVLRGATAQRCC